MTGVQTCALPIYIRRYIIKTVSVRGGHLASSLGAVEICIAGQYCLATPRDTIIFDVGHQAYAYKILTGRKELFSKLRVYKGLSGFPNSTESIYDVYISGHASTAVSWAQGITEAKRLRGVSSKTVAIIGDGSLSGGMCLEALNNCGNKQNDLLIILNHNEMSISRSVGTLGNYLTKIISLPIYNRIRVELDNFVRHFPPFARKISSVTKKLEEVLKGLIVPGLFFEQLGFRYFGPINGHNLKVLIPALRNILPLPGPKILHVVTTKGKGYKFAEDNPEDFHGVSAFNISTGRPLKKEDISFSKTLAYKLVDLAKKDKRIVAITAAMSKGTGLNIFCSVYPERFFDVGIAEEHAVGLASGMARAGLKPFVVIYSTFIQRAFDQIIHDVALQNLPVSFCLDRSGFVGADGPTHHGVFDIGFLRIIPNMICMAPKDKEELQDMLEFAANWNGPVSLRYPKGEVYSLGRREKVILGKAQILTEGPFDGKLNSGLCVIALGSMVKPAYEAVGELHKEGINVCLVNARFIKPLDKELLTNICNNFKFIVTVEEGVLNCGFGSAVLEFYEKHNYLNKVTVKRLGIKNEFSTFASRKKLLELSGLTKENLVNQFKLILDKDKELLWQR